MKVLRGSGSTFSTSGKRWHGFPIASPTARKVAGKNARLRRLLAKGVIAPLSKAQQRELAAQATKDHAITRCPAGKVTIASRFRGF